MVSHQVWFLTKVKDSPQTLGRYDGAKIEQASVDLMEYCKDLVSWMVQLSSFRSGILRMSARELMEEVAAAQKAMATHFHKG